MGKLLLGQFLNEDNESIRIATSDVYDISRTKDLAQILADIETRLDATGDNEAVASLRSDVDALQAMVNDFLTGEDNDNGVLDRLKELVAEIGKHAEAIDAFNDKAAKADLDALAAKVEELEGKNWEVLDGIGKNAATGNLTFNGKELNGETGIAFGATAEAATSYTGKLKIVLQEIEVTEEA